MFKLYSRANSGSLVVEAILEHVGARYQLIEVEGGKPSAELIRLNPLGQVPVLMLPDDSVMTESAGMTIYLADIYPEAKLAPSVTSPQRSRYLRWMLFLAANIYMTDLRVYYPDR